MEKIKIGDSFRGFLLYIIEWNFFSLSFKKKYLDISVLFEVYLTQSGLGKRMKFLNGGSLSTIFAAGAVASTTYMTM